LKAGRPSRDAALVLLGVFLLGAASGVIGAGFMARRHVHAMFEGTEEEVETRVTLTLLDPLLRLSSDERAKVREILERNAIEHTRLREAIEPGLTALRAKERAEIRAVLTPDQQARFDRVLARVDAHRGRLERVLEE